MAPGSSQHAGEDPATGHLPGKRYDPDLPPLQPKWCRRAQDWLVCPGHKGDCERVCMHVGFFNYIKMPDNAEKAFERTIKRKTRKYRGFFSTNLLVWCQTKVVSDNRIVTVSKL